MSEPSEERSRGALYLLVAIFAAGALWFVVGNEETAAPVVRGARAPAFSLSRYVSDSVDGAGSSSASRSPSTGPSDPRSDSAASALSDPASTGSATATAAPELALASLAGRVVLLNFWATWCEPCEREMPAMQRLYQRLPRDRFELVAISIDEEPAKIADFVARYALTFPIVLDQRKRVAETYQTMGVPESLLIDRDGRIVERYVGPREWDSPEYVTRIEALLEGAAVGSTE
jgi:thiol-disulfide isomerase/thioredoxin